MSIYDSPTSVNMTSNPSGLFAYLNHVTNYWFSNALIIVIWVIFFMGFLSTNKEDFVGAGTVASFVTVCLALLGWLAGIVSGMALSILIGATLIFGAVLFAEKKNTV